MDNTWLIPFTKEVGLPAVMAITFIWYFVRVFFPEQKAMMLDTINLVIKKYEDTIIREQQFHEKMLEKIMDHNMEVHNALNKRLDGVVTEIIEFREEISKRLDDVSSKVRTHSQ